MDSPFLLDNFVTIFEVWEQALPFLDLMVTEDEMRLVVTLAGKHLEFEQIAALLGMPLTETNSLVTQAYARCVLDKISENGRTQYAITDFYAFLNHFVKYGDWSDIPQASRKSLDRRFLDEFIARHQRAITRKMQGLESETALPNDTVMLLSEVEEMIFAAQEIVVQPCDCRKLGENCQLPIETCIWLDDGARQALDRGHGRPLLKEEAIQLLSWADKKGLMHTADGAWRERGLHAICNCCACDCYPFRAAQELGTKGIWPKSRYLASFQPSLCSSCGACANRCHFGAFSLTEEFIIMEGKIRQKVAYDPGKCWGCGLCANTCPQGAIEMTGLG